jgi:ATP-binding cassette subfamily F protein uup
MAEQRKGIGSAETERTERRKKAPAGKPRPANRSKLTFKDQHALKTLPGEMEKLAASIAEAERILSDPDLFTRDPAAFEKTQKRLATDQAALEAAEEQWLELEIKREELESE